MPSPPQIDPAKALLTQAKILLDTNRPEMAVPLLLRALSLAPDDADLPCHLSYTYSRLGDLKNSLHYAEEGIRRNPENEWAHRLRGHVFWTKGKLKEAMKCTLEAQRVDPDEPQVYRMQADLFMAQRKYKEAKQAAEQMRDLAPSQAQPFVLLARISLALATQNGFQRAPASHKEAEAFARQALALSPDLSAAHSVLGQALSVQQKTGEALDAFYRASQLDPTAPNIQQNLSQTVFTRFFSLPIVLLVLLLLPLQVLFFRWGGLFAAGGGGAVIAGLCAWAIMRQFAPNIALKQKRFRILPDAQRDTLLGLIQARRGPLRKTAISLTVFLSALPMFLILFVMAKEPQNGRTLIRSMNHAFGVPVPGPAKQGEAREVGPWKITVEGIQEAATKAAQKTGKKRVAVQVSVRNTEDKTFAPLRFPSHLNNAQGQQISETIFGNYGAEAENFSESLTEQTWETWKPYEEKTGYLFFVIGKNDRPVFLVMENPSEPEEGAKWLLNP